MKENIILKHGGGELANQLWNYVSIYAYGIEKGTLVKNPSFFEYHSYFQTLPQESHMIKFLSFWFKDSIQRRSNGRNRFWRMIYRVYVEFIIFFNKNSIISSENQSSNVTYLLPTSHIDPLINMEKVYFVGWLFRNPIGLKKHRNKLISIFSPKKIIEKKVASILTPLHLHYKNVIGLHIRQADYREFKAGTFYIEQIRAKQIAQEYLQENKLTADKTVFIITSDGHIDKNIFSGLHIYISKENSVTDLFLLSGTDAIIGSDSSFGAFASWYGNITHIVMKNDPMDWIYYSNKKEYFENKYCTSAHF